MHFVRFLSRNFSRIKEYTVHNIGKNGLFPHQGFRVSGRKKRVTRTVGHQMVASFRFAVTILDKGLCDFCKNILIVGLF